MKRYIRSNYNSQNGKYIVVLQNGEFMKHDDGRIMQLNDEVETANVDSLQEASKVVRDYIDRKLLGSSTFSGGQVLDARTRKQVARISYNGRIWDLDDNEITDEAVIASMDLEELEDAVLNGRPFEADKFSEYWDAYHQPEEGAITADEVNENDVIENTEDASEINIGDTFHVNSITPHAPGWEEFDYEFDVTLLNGDYKGNDIKLHYMADEYVGIRSDVGRALGIYNSTSIEGAKRSTRTKYVYDVCDAMDWNYPTFKDPTSTGYKCKWGGRSFAKRCAEDGDDPEDIIKQIKDKTGIQCRLTREGNLVIPYCEEKDVSSSTRKAGTRHREISNDLRSILEDVMIETLDDYSGKHILVEFIENARSLQDWDEYGDEHTEEMLELSKLSDVALADIGAEILDEIKSDWQDDYQ